MMRTIQTTARFRRPFMLAGVNELLPAGSYAVEVDEERIDSLSFPAYRRTQAVVYLHASADRPGVTRALTIDPAALDAALARDEGPQQEGA